MELKNILEKLEAAPTVTYIPGGTETSTEFRQKLFQMFKAMPIGQIKVIYCRDATTATYLAGKFKYHYRKMLHSVDITITRKGKPLPAVYIRRN